MLDAAGDIVMLRSALIIVWDNTKLRVNYRSRTKTAIYKMASAQTRRLIRTELHNMSVNTKTEPLTIPEMLRNDAETNRLIAAIQATLHVRTGYGISRMDVA